MFYHAPKAVTYHEPTVMRPIITVLYVRDSFIKGHSLGRMGICMDEPTCEAKLPHKNGNVVRK